MTRKAYTFTIESDVVESVRAVAGMAPLSRFIEAILVREVERLEDDGGGADRGCR